MYLSENYCNKCEKTTTHHNGTCIICTDREDKKRIAEWNSMSDADKQRDLRQRIERLEKGPLRF